MRDRLIELKRKFVENFNCGDCKPENDKCRKCLTEKETDYLIENGVIVLPCKAGDLIYKVVKPKNSNVSDGWIVEQKVAGFHLGDIPRLRGDKRREYFIIFHEPTRYISHIPFDKLGKTVFLTKEEAEKALKESEIK